MKTLNYWPRPVVQYRILWFLSTRCAFFGRGRKTFGGNSLWMFPLDQLSKCLANQWENRKYRVFDGADQTTSDSGLIVLSFWGASRFFPTSWNFSIVGCDSDGVAKKSIGTPNDIHVRFKVDVGQPSTILYFQDLQRQNVPVNVFFLAQLAPQWETTGSRQGVIEMLRNRFFFCWGRMVSSQTIIVLSQKFQWFCSLGFECWYICWY